MSVNVFSTDYLLADKAVASKDDDSFKRYPFARQLAATICERSSAESLVIGLYGQWGAGKTSVLNFVQAELAGTDVLTVYFNPWRFDGEEQLLQGFFAELGLALRAVTTKEAKEAAHRAGAHHGQQVISKLQILDRDARSESLQDFKSQAKLEQLKKEINELLRTSGKRVLVLIDDIDRLSAPEMHAVLRLVKLTGDFQYTTRAAVSGMGIVIWRKLFRYHCNCRLSKKRRCRSIFKRASHAA
jgi:predicted KAP-like P-loop ATPase